jgi:hypothetical protein
MDSNTVPRLPRIVMTLPEDICHLCVVDPSRDRSGRAPIGGIFPRSCRTLAGCDEAINNG